MMKDQNFPRLSSFPYFLFIKCHKTAKNVLSGIFRPCFTTFPKVGTPPVHKFQELPNIELLSIKIQYGHLFKHMSAGPKFS